MAGVNPTIATTKAVEVVQFVDANGKALFNQGGGLAALTFMKKLLDEGLVDPASLSQTEDDVNSVVSAGQAAMALNWTYGLSVMNDPSKSTVAGKIKVAPSPGEGSVTTSGAGVVGSRYSGT